MKSKISFDRLLLYITSVIAITLLGITIYRGNQNETVFVDIGKMVSNYKFKKDLEAGSSKDLDQIKNGTDSIRMLRRLASGTAAAHLDTILTRREYAFRAYYEQSNQEISKKIWERLNPVIEAYGKEKKLDLIIGANGAGTVLYGSTHRDITDDLVKYVNAKYEKGS